MYYDMANNTSYNLEKVFRVQYLKGLLKYGYKYYKDGRPEKRWFFGLFVDYKALAPGYYYITWDGITTPATEEEARYGDNVVEVWFVGDKYNGREWTFNNAEEALDFIDKCKQSSSACKFVK